MPVTPAPLVVAGGSLATGRELAYQAGATGRDVRLVDEPGHAVELRAALAGAAAVAIIPARTVVSLAAQVQAVPDAIADAPSGTIDDAGGGPQIVLVTGFSIGHGLAHALNTPERLDDRRSASPWPVIRHRRRER